MSLPPKVSSLQAYHLLLFRTALHPEFFAIVDRRRIEHGEYEFEAWISKGGHALRFEHHGLCITEVVTAENDPLPDRGLVTSLPCAGERDHESDFAERVSYLASVQTETLSDHLYLSTFNELHDHAKSANALVHQWHDQPDKPNMSIVDTQRYYDEVHVQCYHLRSDCSLVLRTQTIFQVKDPDKADGE